MLKAISPRWRKLVSDDSGMARNRFFRFLLAGVINTLFGYLVYCAALFAGSSIWMALLIGTVSGTLFNFLTTAGYVFRQLTLSLFPRFLSCYALVYLVNLGLIKLLSNWLQDGKLSQLILVFPMAMFSYFLMSRVVFPPVATGADETR